MPGDDRQYLAAQNDGQIRLRLSTPFAWKRQPVVVFRKTEPSRRYQLYVNGAEVGAWRGEELEKGVSLKLDKRTERQILP